ncbi:embryo defective 2170 [Prunus dulcis]|uniref:Embryo defective 2170 n=1 Tax=Prunus dulcis TaxID=3755 RepID=A0A4Y1RET9_PRUDU|nr:embryo defective 2170 [Prunus dulcis]
MTLCQNFPRNHLSPSCHVRSSRRGSAEEKDFDFWETNTLLRWNIEDESSPLLPNHHHYSNPCTMTTLSQRQAAIVQSRRELMEMIQDMPESCYELSLKDIVDDEQQGAQGVGGEETDAKETSFSFRSEEVQIRKQKSNVKKKSSYEISRTCSSMESETFLLKMFFPTFLGSKKKPKSPGNRSSKVTPSPSLSLKDNHKDWCKIRTFFLAGVNKNNQGNNSSCSSRTRFSDETNALPGCWFFFHSKKSKTKRQKGCLL